MIKRHKNQVVKTLPREKHESRKEYHERALHEYRVLRNLHHKHVISVGRCRTPVFGLVSFAMDAGLAENVYQQARTNGSKVSTREALCVWKQIVSGVLYLHQEGLCHRDLKLENVVFDRENGTVKLIDFATATSGGSAVGIVGSKRYMAPEMYSEIHYAGFPVDVWSLGIMAYFLLNRRFPWNEAHLSDADFRGYTEKGAISGLLEAIWPCLAVLPTSRISVQSLADSEWFQLVPCCDQSVCGEHVMK